MGQIIERSVNMVANGEMSSGSNSNNGDNKKPLVVFGQLLVGLVVYGVALQLMFGAGFLMGKVAGFLFTGADCEIFGMPFEVLTGLLVAIRTTMWPKVEIDA